MQVKETRTLRLPTHKGISENLNLIDNLLYNMDRRLGVVVGLGEVGRPLWELLIEAHGPNNVKGLDIEKPPWAYHFEFMHICYPQGPGFIDSLNEYFKKYDPRYVIIHSTLHPGTLSKLRTDRPFIYYSPVRGNLRDGMTWGLKHYAKFIAPVNMVSHVNIEPVLDHLGMLPLEVVESAETLEYAKLFNLAYYGTCIGVFQEIERIIEQEGLDYEIVKDFIISTEEDSEGKVPRPLYYGGYIGGHCVIPALEKLVAKHDSHLFKATIMSNIRRARELSLKT